MYVLLERLLNHVLPHILSYAYAPIFRFLTGHNLLKLGQQVHAHMALCEVEPDAFLAAKMVAMYASSGNLKLAMAVFHMISGPSALLYNSILWACAWYGYFEITIGIFFRTHSLGVKGDNFTFPFVLKSCAKLSSCWMGKCVHGWSLRIVLEFDMYVGTSLIDMHVKCGEFADARKSFDKMTVRDISSWNALIAGYTREGKIQVAEDLFRECHVEILFLGLL